jgi:hypothetical protein
MQVNAGIQSILECNLASRETLDKRQDNYYKQQ